MNDTRRVKMYLRLRHDVDEFMLFGVAHINVRGGFDRTKIEDDVSTYQRTGDTPQYVSTYLDRMN